MAHNVNVRNYYRNSHISRSGLKAADTVAYLFLPAGCRKRQTAGIKFTHMPKISIFVPQGWLVAPIHLKFGTTKGQVDPIGHTKFHVNRFTGWERGPQNIQNFHFLQVAPAGWKCWFSACEYWVHLIPAVCRFTAILPVITSAFINRVIPLIANKIADFCPTWSIIRVSVCGIESTISETVTIFLTLVIS